MTGFEVVGVVLGIIPLVLVAFERIQGALKTYHCLEKSFRTADRNIKVARGQFQEYIRGLLSPILEYDRIEKMLGDPDPSNKYWQLESFDDSQQARLRQSFEPILFCIEGFNEATRKYEETLLELSESEESPVRKLIKSTFGVVGVQGQDVREPLKLSRKKRLRLSLNSPTESPTKKLDSIYQDMLACNRGLQTAMICQINRKISGTSRSGIDPRQEKQSPSTLQKNNLNSRTIQETKNASNQLHGILCNFPMLQCNCHSLHLRLDFNTQASSPTEGKQFSFLMTSTTHKDACTDSEDSVLHLVFARNDGKAPNANTPCIGISEPCATLCKELLPLSNPYERFFPAPNSGSDSGFVLRRKVDTTADSITSLANMLSNLIPGDCYQIALNLTHSVLLHYSSPWLRDWTLDTIRFVKNHGSLKPTWTPHLTVSFSGATNQHQFGCQNREVYSLGLILLQVGRKRPLDSIKDSPQALQTAVDELCGMVGLRYRKVVWNCLYKWNDNRIDLMDEEHIRCFWADICELQSLVSEFVYGVS